MFQNSYKLNILKPLRICFRLSNTLQSQPCARVGRKPCIPDTSALDPKCPQPKVVIIGAGLAGLSAAHRLITCGLKRVIVLEAQDRPGGRIHTKKFGDKSVDLGATWINGACTGNPAFTLACQDEAIQSPMVRAQRDLGNCFDSKGRYIKSKVVTAAMNLFDDIEASAKTKYKAVSNKINLWSFFDKEIQQIVPLFPSPDKSEAEKVLYGLTNELQHTLGTPLECVPLNMYGRIKTFPGGVVAVKSGMSRILNPLLRVIADNRIKYNKEVVKIIWKQILPTQTRATVVTRDGLNESADYVIVAVPLGVLKAAGEQMFSPPLPEDKLAAIKNLGLGQVTNIVLKYAKPFWIKGEGHIRLCWTKEELAKRDHWSKNVNLIEEIPTTDDLLQLTVSGPGAEEVECLSDCELTREVTRLMRRFLDNATIPMPTEVFRTPWKKNSFFGGGTTYLGMGSVESDIARLARPIPEIGAEKAPVVLFAGEACVVQYLGLAAARLSGIMEAERILNYTKCFCGPPPPPQRVSLFGCG